jgi:type VI secretion system protein VasD
VLLTSIVACSSPPPPPPTVVNLTVSASPDVNPTDPGQAAPIVVRVYQLASPTSFEQAEFFQLFNQDQAFLKTDLVKRDDFLLAPGQTKTATLTPTDQVKALGVLAAYRDFQHATWRATVPVPPHQTTKVTITAGRDAVVVKAEAVKAGT